MVRPAILPPITTTYIGSPEEEEEGKSSVNLLDFTRPSNLVY
ncbi:MAG TPA: hypothetical protein VFY68_11030 [Nitrososphaeraceae archaeon]|nr:hypothetical protein [Nitrososphaeraceae archaeon]